MSKLLKWTLAIVGIVILALAIVFVWNKTHSQNLPPAPAPAPTVLPTQAPTLAPTSAPAPAPTAQPAPKAVPTEMKPVEAPKPITVTYDVPGNAIAIKDASGAIKVFTYTIGKTDTGTYPVLYPYQSTVIVALGNAEIDYGTGTATLTSDGKIGNIFTDICTNQDGCKLTVSKYTAGHAQVTIIFGGKEVPAESLAWAINNMLKSASNCGASACKSVIVTTVKGAFGDPFTKVITASDVSAALTAPVAPFAVVNPAFKGVPQGAEVMTSGKTPIGQVYFLADKDAAVSVPEGGITVIYCGSKAEVDGKTCKAGMAMALMGTASDGATPEDLNRTIAVTSNDPTMIKVYMIYGGDPQAQLAQIKADHPDWDWK